MVREISTAHKTVDKKYGIDRKGFRLVWLLTRTAADKMNLGDKRIWALPDENLRPKSFNQSILTRTISRRGEWFSDDSLSPLAPPFTVSRQPVYWDQNSLSSCRMNAQFISGNKRQIYLQDESHICIAQETEDIRVVGALILISRFVLSNLI